MDLLAWIIVMLVLSVVEGILNSSVGKKKKKKSRAETGDVNVPAGNWKGNVKDGLSYGWAELCYGVVLRLTQNNGDDFLSHQCQLIKKKNREPMTGCGDAQGKNSRRMNPVNPLGDLGEPLKDRWWARQKWTGKLLRVVRRQNYKSWKGSGCQGRDEGVQPVQHMNQTVFVQNLAFILCTFLSFVVVVLKKMIFQEVITLIPCHISPCWKRRSCQVKQ